MNKTNLKFLFVNGDTMEQRRWTALIDSMFTKLNTTTLPDGSASDPSIHGTTATGAGIHFGSNIVYIDTAGTARVYVDAQGDININGGRGIDSNVTNGKVPFVIVAAQDAVSDTAACSVANYYSTLTTTGAAVPTLADGTIIGQMKKIQMIVDAGDAVLTPANLNGGTTITFADVGDTAELVWNGTGWTAVALYNIVDGATAPVLA